MGKTLQFKDWWVLSHVHGIAIALTVLLFKHPEASSFVAPVICALVGYAVHAVFTDDHIKDE